MPLFRAGEYCESTWIGKFCSDTCGTPGLASMRASPVDTSLVKSRDVGCRCRLKYELHCMHCAGQCRSLEFLLTSHLRSCPSRPFDRGNAVETKRVDRRRNRIAHRVSSRAFMVCFGSSQNMLKHLGCSTDGMHKTYCYFVQAVLGDESRSIRVLLSGLCSSILTDTPLYTIMVLSDA